jgi:hypothetical protein
MKAASSVKFVGLSKIVIPEDLYEENQFGLFDNNFIIITLNFLVKR